MTPSRWKPAPQAPAPWRPVPRRSTRISPAMTAEVASASEVDVLTSLSKRRAELDSRERRNPEPRPICWPPPKAGWMPRSPSSRICRARSPPSRPARCRAGEADHRSGQDLYQHEAKKAAPIFNNLPDDFWCRWPRDMKPEDLALIMANMSPDSAQKLTVKLASRLALPATTGGGPCRRRPLPCQPGRPAASAAPAAAKAAPPPC